MGRPIRPSRRRLLQLTGASTVALLAGCADDVDDDDDDADEVDDTDDIDDEWEDVDEFTFEGYVQHWLGIEPSIIEDEENPTLTLIEGQEYDFRWINGDGSVHNLEIRDEDDEIVEDYQSDDVSDEGEETTLEGVVASEEMAVYICEYHEASQVGDIEVVSE